MFKRVIHLLFCICSCCFISKALAQKIYLVSIPTDTVVAKDTLLLSKLKYEERKSFLSSTTLYQYLHQFQASLRENGYLAASIDSVHYTDTLVTTYWYQGHKYEWAQLRFDSIPNAILAEVRMNATQWIKDKRWNAKRYNALCEKLLQYAENNGYPFAQVYLDNIQQVETGIVANLMLNKGALITIDTLIIDSDMEIASTFIQTYLGIHQGDVYNESTLKLISKKLRELPYLQEKAPWQMEFSIAKNKLKLFLKEKKANQINGLIGLQPNTVETGKFMFTADILLGLKNALGLGESFNATYQNLQYQSPKFYVDAAIPYILGTPMGIEGSFDLFKRDTSYVRVTFDVGLKYFLSATDFFKVSYQQYSNRLNSVDIAAVKATKKLPNNLDISSHGVAVAFNIDRTDYKLNPHKGWMGHVQATGLLRSVQPNNAIVAIADASGFNYTSLYDTLKEKKSQYRILAQGAYFFPLFKSVTLKLGYQGGYISGTNLFMNELFQIGGFKILRGFDEQSIYANQYHIGTAELRLLLGGNSYFYLFTDNGYFQSHYNQYKVENTPSSFGGGIALENKSGIFNVAIGLGKRSGEDFKFNQTKIHFGYTAFF
jgi:outer membrane protein assembly factor BamA